MQIGLGYFDIISKNPVKSHLQARYAGPFSLRGSKICNPTFSVPAQRDQFVQLSIISLFDNATLFDQYRRVLMDCLIY